MIFETGIFLRILRLSRRSFTKADVHEFENADKRLFLGREYADFFFKGWKQVPLHVYIGAGKVAHSSSFCLVFLMIEE